MLTAEVKWNSRSLQKRDYKCQNKECSDPQRISIRVYLSQTEDICEGARSQILPYFYFYFLSILIGISRLSASLPQSLGYMTQKENRGYSYWFLGLLLIFHLHSIFQNLLTFVLCIVFKVFICTSQGKWGKLCLFHLLGSRILWKGFLATCL